MSDHARALLAVAIVQAVGTALLPGAPRLGAAVVIAASAVQLALGLQPLVLVETRHELVGQLIVAKGAYRRVAADESEARRLEAPRRRAQLARSLEQIADMAERPGSYLAGARPSFNVRVVRAVAPELRELAGLLRRRPQRARSGVAAELAGVRRVIALSQRDAAAARTAQPRAIPAPARVRTVGARTSRDAVATYQSRVTAPDSGRCRGRRG